MSAAGGFSTLRREDQYVVKVVSPEGSPDSQLVTAMLSHGCDGAHHYVDTLRGVGVALPPDLTVRGDNRAIAVRHRWVQGPSLPTLAADSPAAFVTAVTTVGAWIQRLESTDARLDTNLANFRLSGGRVVTMDILPPLLTSLQPPPRDLFDTLFYALCFDTRVTRAALAGYAARQLLTHAHPQALPDCVPVLARLCPRVDRATAGAFPLWWFQFRAAAGVRALQGRMSREEALRFFSETSVLAFRSLTERQRARRVRDVRERARELDL